MILQSQIKKMPSVLVGRDGKRELRVFEVQPVDPNDISGRFVVGMCGFKRRGRPKADPFIHWAVEHATDDADKATKYAFDRTAQPYQGKELGSGGYKYIYIYDLLEGRIWEVKTEQGPRHGSYVLKGDSLALAVAHHLGTLKDKLPVLKVA